MQTTVEPLALRTAATVLGRVLALAMAALLVFRRPRPIHATGLVLTGRVRWRPPGPTVSGVRWIDSRGAGGTDAVEARISRGGGFPAALPDLIGLAVRFGTDEGDADLLVSGTGSRFPWRFLLQPRWTTARQTMSTVMPYRGTAGPVVLAARTRRPRRMSASFERIAGELRADPWIVDLAFSGVRGRWHRFAELELQPGGGPLDTDRVRFDPMLHPLPGADIYPWTRLLREPSYLRARRGKPRG